MRILLSNDDGVHAAGLRALAAAFEGDDPLLAGEMKLHFAVEDAPGGTQITVRHEGIPARVSVQENERGTQSSLRNLARLLEGPDA